MAVEKRTLVDLMKKDLSDDEISLSQVMIKVVGVLDSTTLKIADNSLTCNLEFEKNVLKYRWEMDLGKVYTLELLKKKNADTLIMATGSYPWEEEEKSSGYQTLLDIQTLRL